VPYRASQLQETQHPYVNYINDINGRMQNMHIRHYGKKEVHSGCFLQLVEAGIKSLTRAVFKAIHEKDGDFTQLKDVARAKTISSRFDLVHRQREVATEMARQVSHKSTKVNK